MKTTAIQPFLVSSRLKARKNMVSLHWFHTKSISTIRSIYLDDIWIPWYLWTETLGWWMEDSRRHGGKGGKSDFLPDRVSAIPQLPGARIRGSGSDVTTRSRRRQSPRWSTTIITNIFNRLCKCLEGGHDKFVGLLIIILKHFMDTKWSTIYIHDVHWKHCPSQSYLV